MRKTTLSAGRLLPHLWPGKRNEDERDGEQAPGKTTASTPNEKEEHGKDRKSDEKKRVKKADHRYPLHGLHPW